MLAALHDPYHVEPLRLRLPTVHVLYFKSNPVTKASRHGFFGRHPRLDWTDGHAGYVTSELFRKPECRSAQAATDVEHARAHRDRGSFSQSLNQLNLRDPR